MNGSTENRGFPRHVFVFYSVHEALFVPVLQSVRAKLGRDVKLSGFVWSTDQELLVRRLAPDHGPLVVFTRDVLPRALARRPNLQRLLEIENEIGFSLTRAAFSERHLLHRYDWAQVQSIIETAYEVAVAAIDDLAPDALFSEDVSCLNSYLYYGVARMRRIPYWFLTRSRIPGHAMVYRDGLQRWNRTLALFEALGRRGLTADERAKARTYIDSFRNRPERPSGMAERARTSLGADDDIRRLRFALSQQFGDRRNPTAVFPLDAIRNRLARSARAWASERANLFEEPVHGEPYVLFPIHYQPEASTLVLAPYYVDQVALVADIARSVPAGFRVYVKEHPTNRGRRPLQFYRDLRCIFGVRLLSPHADSWSLIKNASAVATITGTMGWEALLYDRPVVAFGEAFYSEVPTVHRAMDVPKDGWSALFQRAIASPVPSPDVLERFVSAIQQTSHVGHLQGPRTLPRVLEASNVADLADALIDAASDTAIPVHAFHPEAK